MQQQDTFVKEHTFFPFGKGTLTSDGIQFSTSVEATAGSTEVLVESVTVNPGGTGLIEEIAFSLTASYKSDTTTKDVTLVWDAKQTDSTTWVELATYTQDDPGTALVEYTLSGVKSTATNLLRVPIDIRLNFSGEDASVHSDCKAKNSSWVKLKWRPSTQG